MDERTKSIILSNGEPSARGYAVATVRPSAPEPVLAPERVLFVCPTRTPTRTGPPVSSGPRASEQLVWPPPKAAAIHLPDRRPVTRAQRFWIDPELLAQWDAEADAERNRTT